MEDDQDFEMWDDEFIVKAIEAAEAVPTATTMPQLPPPQPPPQLPLCRPPIQSQPQPPQLFRPPPPPISYSPPRELSQRVIEVTTHNHFFDKAFDFPNAINETFRLNEVDNDSWKQKEIDRLKDELGRVSKQLTNLEQECLELRKDREKKEKHYRSVFPVNGSIEAGALPTKTPNLKSKDLIEDNSVILLRAKGKAVGVQTDEHALSNDEHAKPTDDHALLMDSTIRKNVFVSRKLAGFWDSRSYQQPKSNLVSKLLVACEADLQFLFGYLGLNVSSKETTKTDMAPKHGIQALEAAKVSQFYLTLTKISYDIRGLGDFLAALSDLCCLQNMTVAHSSLCVLHVVLKNILSMENRLRSRDNVIINDPSNVNRSSEKHTEMGHLLCEITQETTNSHHSVLTKLIGATTIWNEDTLRDESLPLISHSKWFSFFKMMNQVATQHREEIIRVEAISIMNILLLRTDAYAERKMYGEVAVFQSISQLLRKEAGLGVQKQTVYLLYLLLNCPSLMSMFCSSCKEEGTSAGVPTTSAETPLTSHCSGAILEGLADCLACPDNGALTTLVLKLQRKAIILLALLASSGRLGFEVLLGSNLPKRTNFLHLILQIVASEIDVEASESIQPSDAFKERTLLIREALILLNRLASHSQYSIPVLRVLTNPSGMACLAVDIAHRVSRQDKWQLQSDTKTKQTRESEVVDLARRFKKTLFTFLEDTTSQK
uniref:protein SENSITIVE TO UV 2 n=1 Tax=Erigeron canadensis TaxID=72917 RepID=UPI001CB9376E|nr:protein SENSITIVE TO UV 2 [Erigeron canadensis]